MKMVFSNDRAFARLQTAAGGELACVRLSDGVVVWRSPPGNRVVSDPLFVDGRLVALVAVTRDASSRGLHLANFDPHTGEVLALRLLAQLGDPPDRAVACRAIAAGDRIVATFDGGALCCDLCGELLWLRHQPRRSMDADSMGAHPAIRPPLVHGDAACFLQAGGPGIECLDLANGLLRWGGVLPEAVSLVGIAESRLIVRTASAVTAVDIVDGSVAWSREIADPREAWLGPGGLVLVYSTERNDSANPFRLTWLNAASGTVAAETTPAADHALRPISGPLLTHSNRTWVIATGDTADASCRIVELVRIGDAP